MGWFDAAPPVFLTPIGEGGTYYLLKDDGAPHRCFDCGELVEHTHAIVFEHTETKKRAIICFDCIDNEWLSKAKCIGSL